jgi:hypothetical protein
MITIAQVADEIEAKGSLNKQYEASEVERDFHNHLVVELMARGWKHYNSHSQCKVAFGEDHLEKNGKHMEIITTSFMGRFTMIQMS